MSLRVLGNPDNEVALLLGCGVQGHTSLEAIAVADKNLKKAYVYDILPEAAQRLAENLSKKLELDIIPVTDPRPVVPEADVFVTAGPYDVSKDISFITADMVKPSATITTVDFDIFFAQGFIDKAVGKYYTDDIHQYEHFLPSIRPMHSVPVELGDAMVGKYPLREKHDEICFAMNIGMAMDDLILAQEIYRRAIEQKIGRILPL